MVELCDWMGELEGSADSDAAVVGVGIVVSVGRGVGEPLTLDEPLGLDDASGLLDTCADCDDETDGEADELADPGAEYVGNAETDWVCSAVDVLETDGEPE